MSMFAMVFPGQGSLKVGCLTDLASHYKIIKTTFSEASSVLGYDLWKIIQRGPLEKLNNTCQSQPALLASSVAIWRIWKQKNGKSPNFLAGHSLGEYSALVCSDSLEFAEAIKLVAFRGKIMQEAVPEGQGAMSVIIGLNNSSVAAACKKAEQGQIVSPANFNSPQQIVISGHKEAVERANVLCKEIGARKTLFLPISVPSHCILMKPVSQTLAKKLEDMRFVAPRIPVINNVDVRNEESTLAIRQALIRQLYNPVRWTETIEYFSSQGVEFILEIGPGQVLTKLTKRIVDTISGLAVNDQSSLITALRY